MTEAPYPADTRAKGWRFEIDHERVEQSNTWALAPPETRPWLLMLWTVAWRQTPCGSLDDDDALIAARNGMPVKAFARHRQVLMRGWWKATDGRLYHNTIAERVHDMLVKRAKDAERAANNRARRAGAVTSPPDVTRDTPVTPNVLTQESDPSSTPSTKHQAPEPSTRVLKTSEAIASAVTTAQDAAVDEIYALGLPLLAAAGTPVAQARSFLGLLRKYNHDTDVAKAIARCAAARALQPISFLQGCLKTGAKHVNRQEALEADGKRVAAEWLRESA